MARLFKTVVRDPGTYAPAVIKYSAMRLDWDSSQIFFRHGFVERNARYTVSGRSNDVALGYAAGNRKLAMDSLVVLAQSVSSNLGERTLERFLIRHYPSHKKFWFVTGHAARIVGSASLAYATSARHVTQWRRNERLARELGYK